MGARPNGTKIALITGANRGIGFEVARQLGRRGMAVMIGARDLQRGADAAKTLRGEDLDARHVQLDVTDERTIRAAGRQEDVRLVESTCSSTTRVLRSTAGCRRARCR